MIIRLQMPYISSGLFFFPLLLEKKSVLKNCQNSAKKKTDVFQREKNYPHVIALAVRMFMNLEQPPSKAH